MTAIAAPAPRVAPAPSWRLIWGFALVATVLLHFAGEPFAPLQAWPDGWRLPASEGLGALMLWLKQSLVGLTRTISAVLDVPLDFATGLLAKGFRVSFAPGSTTTLPPLSWLAIIGSAALASHAAGGLRTALLVTGCFVYMLLFGQWVSAMQTLSLIIICVPICVVAGLLAGAFFHGLPALRHGVLVPLLDLMQTVPTFAYLVPMLLFFGINPVSALLATAIYAVPPMVRTTLLALDRVPVEVAEFGRMVGCTPHQQLWKVMLPSARPVLMVGVNQVIMLALNMVIVSSMIGAGGLGYDVLLALRSLDIGRALEAGMAIVALAIALDRFCQACARRRPAAAGGRPRRGLTTLLVACLLLCAGTWLISLEVAWLARFPREATFTTAPMWKQLVAWINLHFFDTIDATRTFILLNLLNPVKAFMLAVPWVAAVGLAALAGLQFGGWRLALLVAVLLGFCATTGLWEKAITTVYLCGVSSVIAAALGIPIGVWAARSPRVDAVVQPVIDTLQTLPSFVFLIPVVMLFRVGDVTAMIAVVAYAIAPAIRYTIHGIRSVPPHLVEAAIVAGCTPLQVLRRVQLPLALPEIMLGMSQTVLLALSMLVITALVGTRDLGQEVYLSLAKADSGRGLTAGFAIAFLGIVADRLMAAASRRMRVRLAVE